jgi:hypothetical protein
LAESPKSYFRSVNTPEQVESSSAAGRAVEVKVEREVRFAVVMYGGVSLAIYINGVAQELLNMVRATASKTKHVRNDRCL